jgi:signal transduction histidine kinase
VSTPAASDGAAQAPVPPVRVGALLIGVGYGILLVAVTLLSLTWLVVGAVVGVAAHVPSVAAGLAAAAGAGNRWARGVLDAMPRSEPFAQAVLDYGFSLLSLGIAVGLLAVKGGGWSIRLLVLALVGSAGAFNLQAHAADTAVQTATGLAIGGLHQVLLHGVACAAYVLALLVFPPDRGTGKAGLARAVLVAAGVGSLLLVGFGTALLPHTTSCVLFFGFLVPVAGLLALPRRIRQGTTAAARTQARLLFSVLAASFAITIVLAIITLLLWSIGWTGLVLVDPTAHPGAPGPGEPTALLFWFSRLACIAIAGAVLVATRPGGLWTAERLFSRGLVAALVAALVGGGYVLVRTMAGELVDDSTLNGAITAAALAVVLAALSFLPVYVRAERLVDRLLYGTRPTPYSVLAGIAALSRATATDAPDLARVAEAVGRGLGATTCQLTVVRPGLHDRTYTWAEPGVHASDALVEVAVRHGVERIGTISVDHTAVAGLQGQRQHLLEDIADSLGAVFQASRSGIELERQLRAALAHAGEIAVSRRAVVAEMDGERRRIERDLHDGAQHHLVSLRLTLGLVEHQVSTAQFAQARARLDQVAEQIDTAESILAETATGVSSPLLAERGLVGALDKELGEGHPPVAVDSAGVDADLRIPPDVEGAVYFCCLEAVNNARKHAPGAAIGVRISTAEGRVQFTVHDDGPGWNPATSAGSPGRGMRNVTARIAAVGGRIEIRSEPGAGTVMEGSAPLPAPAAEPAAGERAPVPSRAGGPRIAPPAAVAADVPLIDEVRDALRAARELYHGTPLAEPLRALAEQLDEPVRVAVVGPAGAGASTLVEALRAASAGELAVTLVDVPGPGPASPTGAERASAPALPDVADAFVLLLRHRHPEDVERLSALQGDRLPHRPSLTIGVLGRADELADADRVAGEWAALPEVRRLCHVVVPVAGLLARAAARLTDAEYRTLRGLSERGKAGPQADGAGQQRASGNGAAPGGAPTVAMASAPPPASSASAWSPEPARRNRPTPTPAGSDADEVHHQELLDQFGSAGLELAVELIRSGRALTADALAAELIRLSGVRRLLELIGERFAGRAEAIKARAALLALEDVVRTDPPPGGGSALAYRLDRIRSGAHELTEIDLVDALRSGGLDLPDGEREVAERLLGDAGAEPGPRLGLGADAGPQEVAVAATAQLARWQRLGSHPMSSKDVREVAAVLVQTCEQLLARAGHRDLRVGGAD